jgi:hypothetical protein
MKATVILSLSAILALPAWAADAADEIQAAAKKLADQSNYSWTTKTDSPQTRADGQQGDRQGGRQGGRGRGGFGFGGGTTDGKIDKSGFILVTLKTGTNTTEAVVKGSKVAIKEGDEWKTSDELADSGDGGGQGRFNRSQFTIGRVQRIKAPATEAQDLLGRVKELTKEGDGYSGEMTAEAIKQMFTFRGRGGQGGGGGNAPDTSGLKGTVKFWVKDGMLSKYESHIEGKMTGGRNNTGFDVKRTTTVEIKDVGSTKLAVPAEAKKKLSA